MNIAARFKGPLRFVVIAGVGTFLALQLVQPSIEVRAARSEMEMPAEVEAVLRTSCFDCHSNEPRFAWFDRIAPGSWLVARDIRRARARMNFSELGDRPRLEQRAALYEAIEMIATGEMPLAPYRALHPGAKVGDRQVGILKAFAATLAEPTPEPKNVVVSIASIAARAEHAAPEPDGTAFPRDLASWAPIGMSDRFDNGTVRLILGNRVSLDAIARGSLAPWPDGASIAKVAYRPAVDAARSSFVQIEIMHKDARGHAATEGWSWGRWRGESLAPYGRDASFAEECTGCHAPRRASDFVYTVPFAPSQDRLGGARTSFDPAWGAVSSLRIEKGSFRAIVRPPSGPARAITWPSREDPDWFGARVPTGAPQLEALADGESAAPNDAARPAPGAPAPDALPD